MTLRYFDLSGRQAFVTGGSVSIGRAIALGLAEAGADVAIQHAPLADRAFGQPDAAAEAVCAFQALGRRGVAIAADFAEAGAGRRSVREAEAALGPLDIVVLCASVQQRRDFIDLEQAEIDWQVRINFNASLEVLQAVLPGMAERGFGRILSLGSVNQHRPNRDLTVYAALKSALHNVIIGLARDFAGRGVTLNTLSPGTIATERNRWRRQDADEWREIQRQANPMHRAGTPEEMVGAALMFCAPGAGFITGADLLATGGSHL